MNEEALARLPLWLRDLLDNCPAAGDGVHFWIFRSARHLLAHFDETTTCNLLFEGARGSGRPLRVLQREIAVTVKNAFPRRWQPRNRQAFKPVGVPAEGSSPTPFCLGAAWPEANEARIRLIANGNISLADLIERSPVRFNGETSHAEEIIDTLFPGNPLLCVGKGKFLNATRRRETWRGHFHRLPLIVPSPMCAVIGRTVNGHWSEHTKEQIGRRMYLVIEFDFSEFGRNHKTPSRWAPLVREWLAKGKTVTDACAALHLHLAELWPLLCVVHSGGKSLHGWYRAWDHSKTELRRFMEYAVRLGADHATWTRSQFVRIPDGRRENGQRQTCLYLNPSQVYTTSPLEILR